MGKHSRRPPDEEASRRIDPEIVLPPLGLRRAEDGRVVLDELEVERRRADADRQDPAPSTPPRPDRGAAPAGPAPGTARPNDRVAGPIQPTPTIYFGRPPGTENRRAGAAAMVGAVFLGAAALLPWATREPATLGATTLGWRDAQGALGPAPWILLLAAVALGLSIAALSAVLHRALQVGDVLVGVTALGLSIVEWLRIGDAADLVAEITDGRGSMAPGPAILFGVVGGTAMLVAAAVHRSTAPAWRRS